MNSFTGPMILAGVALVVIELARSVPAWLRVRRTRSSDGISPTSVGVLAGTSLGWIAVAVLADSIAAAIATVVWLVFHLLLWREVVRVNPAVGRSITRATVVSFAAMGVIGLGGFLAEHLSAALGVAIGLASAAYSLPALYSGMTSQTTAGLSMMSLLVNSAEGAIYLVGGLGLGGIAPAHHLVIGYIFFGGVALLSNLPRLCRTAYRRFRGRDETRHPVGQSVPKTWF